MGKFKDIGQSKISWKVVAAVVVIIGVVAGGAFAFVKVKDQKCEAEYKEALTRLHGLVDVEGEAEENEPKRSREEMHQIMGREPDESGTVGRRLVDVYHYDGPLTRYRLSIRFEKSNDHKWVLRDAKTYWAPGKLMIRPHKDPLN